MKNDDVFPHSYFVGGQQKNAVCTIHNNTHFCEYDREVKVRISQANVFHSGVSMPRTYLAPNNGVLRQGRERGGGRERAGVCYSFSPGMDVVGSLFGVKGCKPLLSESSHTPCPDRCVELDYSVTNGLSTPNDALPDSFDEIFPTSPFWALTVWLLWST